MFFFIEKKIKVKLTHINILFAQRRVLSFSTSQSMLSLRPKPVLAEQR